MKTISPDECIQVVRVELEREFYTRRVEIPLNEIEFILRREFDPRRVIAELRGSIWAQRLQHETAVLKVEVPATLWQHVKARWFPRWAKRRWPVRMRTEEATFKFECKALLPDYRYEALRGTGTHVLQTLVTPPVTRRFPR